MKWTKPLARTGDTRVKTKFLLFPTRFPSRTNENEWDVRWLCFANIEQDRGTNDWYSRRFAN